VFDRRWIWLVGALALVGHAWAGTLTNVQTVPAGLKVTNESTLEVTFTLTGCTTPVSVTFFRDDGATDSAGGLSNGTNSITLPLLPDLNGQERTVSWNIIKQEASGGPVPIFNALSIRFDNVPPAPPTITSPVFPTTVYTDSFTIQGNVVSSVGGAAVTTGTVYIRRNDSPYVGLLIGAGALQTSPAGFFNATAIVSTLTTGVATPLAITAEDEAGNLSSPLIVQVTRQKAPAPSFSDGPTCQPGGILTNSPAILVRGAVTGSVPPFTVYFFVDGIVESSIQLLGTSPDNVFAHTLNLASQGAHVIKVQAANANTPPDVGLAIHACNISLDSIPPGPPTIIQPNPTLATFLTTGSPFVISGVSVDRAFTTTSGPRPTIQLKGPTGVTFDPASPLTPDDTSSRFETTVTMPSTLADGQYTVYVTSVDPAGNTSSGSSAQVLFTLDRTAPTVSQMRINNVQAPQTNPEVYVGRPTALVQVRTSEDMGSAPVVRFTQINASAMSLGLTSSTARIYSYGFTAATGHDGPVSATVTGGKDQAGNAINESFARLFVVDTTPPTVVSVNPGDVTSVVARSPASIRVLMKDPDSSSGTKSGVDTSNTRIILEGPVGSSASKVVSGTQVPYDPQTVDFIPGTLLKTDGLYRVRVTAQDKVANIAQEVVRTFTLDTTPITVYDGTIAYTPDCGTFVNATTFPRTGGLPYAQATVNDSQFDVNTSDIEVDDFCRAPPKVPGKKTVVNSTTMRYVFNSALKTDGSEDGTYTIAVTLRDLAGNSSPTTYCTFIYDTLSPLVDRTFPADGQKINGTLRHVDATLTDPVPDSCRSRSGIDRSNSTLKLFLKTPNTNVNKHTAGEIKGVLRFVSTGVLDRVLLEIVDKDNLPVGLKNDGSDDGEYRLETQAVDKSGNQSAVTSATFTYDTLSPDLVVDRLKDGDTLSGSGLAITGSTRDNAGGTDIDRVNATLISVDTNGNPTTSVPILSAVTATISTLPVANSGSPPRRTFTFNASLTGVTAQTRARLSVMSYDKAQNYRQQNFTVFVLPTTLPAPILSTPASNASTRTNIVRFEWGAVDGATDYQIRIRTPKGNEVIKRTDGPTPYITVNLGLTADGDGVYQWSVAGVDGGSQLGGFAKYRVFTIDTVPPKVLSVDVQNVSANSKGVITAGETRVTVTFNETMDTSKGLSVKLTPSTGSLAPLVATTLSYAEGVWVGQLVVPENNNRNPDYNGLAEFTLEGGQDLANNLMAVPDHGLLVYEINTGPFLKAAVFQNPIDHRDLIVLIKGFTKDGGVAARIIDLPVATFTRAGETAQSPTLNRINESTFQGTYRFNTGSSVPVTLTITARDEGGNPSTFAITLNVVQVDSFETTIVNSSAASRLKVTKAAVTSPLGIVVIPRSRSLLAEASLFQDAGTQTLTPVAGLDHYGPVGLKFEHPVQVEVNLAAVGPVENPELLAKACVFERVNDRWGYVTQVRDGSTIRAEISTLNPLALLLDAQGPVVEVVRPGSDGEIDLTDPTLVASVKDLGAGVNWDSLTVMMDDRTIDRRIQTETGQITAQLPVDQPGEHTIALKVSDRAGNVTQSSSRLTVPAGFGLSELVPFPNPARMVSRIRYRLGGSVDRVAIAIHDVAGRRVRLLEGSTDAGVNTVDWTLDNDGGSRVANGVYLVRVVVTGQGQKAVGRTKIAVIR